MSSKTGLFCSAWYVTSPLPATFYDGLINYLWVRQIDNDEINATISGDDIVTFSDSALNISKNEIDKALKKAQDQSVLLLELEREIHASKEYLTKVRPTPVGSMDILTTPSLQALKYKEDAGWAAEVDDINIVGNPGSVGGFGMPHHGGSAWDDHMFG